LIGSFVAPVCPGINSVMLSSLLLNQHSSMTVQASTLPVNRPPLAGSGS
jgi:hypothetical protein